MTFLFPPASAANASTPNLWEMIGGFLAPAAGLWTGLGAWLLSPGFGGFAAVFAAVIAGLAVRKQANVTRQSNRKNEWWKRSEWALNRVLSDDSRDQLVGFEMLAVLSDPGNEWAQEHEADLIRAATDAALKSTPRNKAGRPILGTGWTRKSKEARNG